MGQNEEETSEWIGEMGREWTEEERSLGGLLAACWLSWLDGLSGAGH